MAGVKQRWIIAGVVTWALVIGGLAYYSEHTDRPTAREQTTIAEALPTVDTAVARVAATLDPATAVAALGPYRLISSDCKITAARDGARYERVLTVYTSEGSAPALLDRIAAGLPASYGALVKHHDPVHTLDADAGNFVQVRGGVQAPGQIRVSADTGCRPIGGPVGGASLDTWGRAPVEVLLGGLRLSATTWSANRVPCPDGGTLWTVEAVTGPGSAPAPLPDAVRAAVPGSTQVLSQSEVYVYRAGSAGVVVRVTDGALSITSTTTCQ